MSLQKTFAKIIKENVLSEDFRIASFKSNLKSFLKFVANTFSFINTEANHPLIDATIDGACSKLVAGQFAKLKIPKASRVYISAIYASQVLGLALKTKEEVRDHLKSRYGPQLVLAADSLELAMKHLDLTKKRKAGDQDSDRATKRQRLEDPNMISIESQDESSTDRDTEKRIRKRPVRFASEFDGKLKDDFTPEEYAEFEALVEKEIQSLDNVQRLARLFMDYFHRNNLQPVIESHSIKRVKVGETGEVVEIDKPVVIIIDDDTTYQSKYSTD
eukprot:TRINITY_DN5822_c0_g2_i1.p1 TRINITY_DN5822_c0_g2~~TRINITY_DN5822_c0_g2_i1.p1  ORF type:complete len:274 (+),score=37.89 TRINITY_DN5822_c0_g2_i1:499-1320(+)